MKRIPEMFELDESDIAAAITEWLRYHNPGTDKNGSYTVTFTTEEVTEPPPLNAPVGGMSDYRKIAVKAKAVKK